MISITLCGEEIAVNRRMISQLELQYYTENPRIYSIVRENDGEPDQNEIENALSNMEHVKELVQSIKANGGVTDPLIVRGGDNMVLEGNSRLAAYRLLAKGDPIKWGKIKCDVVPNDISDDLVFALLGEYHIVGRKDWAPYEQAGYLWRRNEHQGIEPKQMADELGLSSQKVQHLINVYSFMVKHNETGVSRWSYYDELLKSRAISATRETHPEFDKVIVSKIKSGEIAKAVDIRDKVIKIATVGGKTLKSFIKKKDSLDQCYDRAISRGADNTLYKRLHKFRQSIVEPDVINDLHYMPDNQRKKCEFELTKIRNTADKLLKKLK